MSLESIRSLVWFLVFGPFFGASSLKNWSHLCTIRSTVLNGTVQYCTPFCARGQIYSHSISHLFPNLSHRGPTRQPNPPLVNLLYYQNGSGEKLDNIYIKFFDESKNVENPANLVLRTSGFSMVDENRGKNWKITIQK